LTKRFVAVKLFAVYVETLAPRLLPYCVGLWFVRGLQTFLQLAWRRVVSQGEAGMLGLSFGVGLAYVLCILSTVLCVVWGLVNWNRGDEPIQEVKAEEKAQKTP